MCADEGNTAEEITFHTQSGPLTVARSAVDSSMVANDSTRIALSMTLPYIYPNDAIPSSCSSAESPVVKALCQDLKVPFTCIHAEAHFVNTLVYCSISSPHANGVIDVPLSSAARLYSKMCYNLFSVLGCDFRRAWRSSKS